MSRFSLKNKNILITGASSGIGASCSKICSESGANIILLGRCQERLNKTLNSLKPGRHSALSFDLMDTEAIEKALEERLGAGQSIHGFIHSAGIDITKPLNSLRKRDYDKIFNVNVISGFEIARILSKKKFCEDGASYIFIASVMSFLGEQSKLAYCASKGALLAGSRSMALELARKNIRINCISPAVVRTELIDKLFSELQKDNVEKIKASHPMGIGSPEDIANACVFLLSDEAKWITGSNLVIDGGYSCQ